MVSAFFITVVKILVLLLILVCMVLLLVGMQHYLLSSQSHSEMDDRDNDSYRRQINDDSGVISRYSLFRRFFVADNSDTDRTPTDPRFFQGEGRQSKSTEQSHTRNSSTTTRR